MGRQEDTCCHQIGPVSSAVSRIEAPLESLKCPGAGRHGPGQQVQGLLCHLKVRSRVLGDWGCLCLISKEGDRSEGCCKDLGLRASMGLHSLPRREGRRPDWGCAGNWSWVFLAQVLVCLCGSDRSSLPPTSPCLGEPSQLWCPAGNRVD